MSRPSSVPLLPAREGEVLRRCDATLPVGFPRSDAVFAAGAAVGSCNMPTLLSSNHHDGMDSTEGTTDIATGPELVPLFALQTHSRRGSSALSPLNCSPFIWWIETRSQRTTYDGNGRNASETCIASVPTPTKKWLDSHGQLVRPEGGWSIETATHTIIGRVTPSSAKAAKQSVGIGHPSEDRTITSYSQPRARVLHPYISKFYLVYYEIKE
ncbi:hypothetical protein B0H17DRAFT_1135982, partial [Mycena rosella]